MAALLGELGILLALLSSLAVLVWVGSLVPAALALGVVALEPLAGFLLMAAGLLREDSLFLGGERLAGLLPFVLVLDCFFLGGERLADLLLDCLLPEGILAKGGQLLPLGLVLGSLEVLSALPSWAISARAILSSSTNRSPTTGVNPIEWSRACAKAYCSAVTLFIKSIGGWALLFLTEGGALRGEILAGLLLTVAGGRAETLAGARAGACAETAAGLLTGPLFCWKSLPTVWQTAGSAGGGSTFAFMLAT